MYFLRPNSFLIRSNSKSTTNFHYFFNKNLKRRPSWSSQPMMLSLFFFFFCNKIDFISMFHIRLIFLSNYCGFNEEHRILSKNKNVQINYVYLRSFINQRMDSTKLIPQKNLIGALFDVSGSMRNKYPKNIETDIEVAKISSIFQLLANLVKKDSFENDVEIFSLAFGTNYEHGSYCDLITLLDLTIITNLEKDNDSDHLDRRENLIELLEKKNITNIREPILKYMQKEEAIMIYNILLKDSEFLNDVIKDLPSSCHKGYIGGTVNGTLNIISFFGMIDKTKLEQEEVSKQIKKVLEKHVKKKLALFDKPPRV